jgi:hypothetical protein
LNDVTVSVPLPATIKSKDLVVEIKKNRVKVQVKGEATAILEGELPKEIKVDDSTWTLGEFDMRQAVQGRTPESSTVVYK